MNKNIILAALIAAVTTAASFAGETMPAPYKGVARVEPEYGTGFYIGIQAGINAYQDYGGTRRFDIGNNEIAIEPNEEIGFVGGLKAGYVFGTGVVRPTIEADMYYNGVRADLDVRVNGEDAGINADANLHSGAALANFLLRFDIGRFQPYLGAGAGGYYANVDDVDVTVGGRDFEGEGGDNWGFAWQLVGGADFYFTEGFSVFAEYKFLNYENPDVVWDEDRISQHLAVLGLRFPF